MAHERSVAERSVIGLCVGAAIGLFWWAVYVPASYSLALLVGAHALVGAVLTAAAGAMFARWRGGWSSALGVAGGLLVAPLLLVAPFVLGRLTGLHGLVAIVGAIGLGIVSGLELGRHGAIGATALAAGGLLIAASNVRTLSARETTWHVPAQRVVDEFPNRRVAVIGIDGADFAVVGPMLRSGALPNLAALVARGQHGILRSIKPTLSSVVWTTIFSGQPASVHGLYDWSTSDNRNRRVPMLWDIFGAHGRSSLVINVPGSWPPAPTAGARVLAGFPIPGIVTLGTGQLTGTFVSSVAGDDGPIATYASTPDTPGHYRFDVPLAAPFLRPRMLGVSHPLLDAATQAQLLPIETDHLVARISVTATGVRLESERLAGPVDLPVRQWSSWFKLRLKEGFAYVRALVLDAAEGRLRMYLTPAFQDPLEPQYAFATNVRRDLLAGLSAPYVVEGLGWRTHRDARIVAYLPAILGDFERVHAEAALALLAESKPDLFAYTITVTDRTQHPFWRDHDLAPFGAGWKSHPGLEGHDPVVEAYRLADEVVGEFLKALPSDTLTFVVSDHGFGAQAETGEGHHRDEGIWVAAGPGIAPQPSPHELSVLDFVPTVLRCIGAPEAEDMPGHPSETLCPQDREPTRVASYRDRAAMVSHETGVQRVIDETREEQLRSLGYVE